MNADGTGYNTRKECHKNKSLWNYITTDHKKGEQLEDRRNVGESSCNCEEGTDQRVQSLMFMMMIFSCTRYRYYNKVGAHDDDHVGPELVVKFRIKSLSFDADFWLTIYLILICVSKKIVVFILSENVCIATQGLCLNIPRGCSHWLM